MFRNYEVLCSEGSMFRTKIEGSILRRFYIAKVLCSEKLEGSIFRRFYVPKFQIVHPIESAWGVGTKTHVVDGRD